MIDEIFKTLNNFDISNRTEKNFKGLSYISWAVAYRDMISLYPDMEFKIIEDVNGLPFFEKSDCYFVKTSVKIKDVEKFMILPVMDSNHYAVKKESYEIKTIDKRTGQPKITIVESLDSRNVNDSIMRCLVKNFALFGYGLSLYAGEDIPNIKKIQNIHYVTGSASIVTGVTTTEKMMDDLNARIEDLLMTKQIPEKMQSRVFELLNQGMSIAKMQEVITNLEKLPDMEVNHE